MSSINNINTRIKYFDGLVKMLDGMPGDDHKGTRKTLVEHKNGAFLFKHNNNLKNRIITEGLTDLVLATLLKEKMALVRSENESVDLSLDSFELVQRPQPNIQVTNVNKPKDKIAAFLNGFSVESRYNMITQDLVVRKVSGLKTDENKKMIPALKSRLNTLETKMLSSEINKKEMYTLLFTRSKIQAVIKHLTP